MEEAPGSQLFPEALQNVGVAEERHDQGGACAWGGGKGGKDQLDGWFLWQEEEKRWYIFFCFVDFEQISTITDTFP